jgi:hypothetical protein
MNFVGDGMSLFILNYPSLILNINFEIKHMETEGPK